MSSTDYASGSATELPAGPSQLLDLQGLRQIAQLVENIRQETRSSVTATGVSAKPPSFTRYDETL